ncbi:MAG: transcriptional regulator, AraC family [Paenibacillaceae bacterium]|nr:transcriptional regulator, AraC family [Paenibacillaceae bacterium]
MRYYRKMFVAFVSIAVVYTLLIDVIFVGLYWVPSRRQFSAQLDQTARQASEFTDIRLQTPQKMGLVVNLSEYTQKYLIGSLNDYERLKYVSYISRMSAITSSLNYGMAVTRYEDDYVIMNTSTGNLDFFRSMFYLSEEQLRNTIGQFNESQSETIQIFNVQDDSGKNMYVLAYCQWVGLPQPFYIFNSYYEQQLFHMDALSTGTLALYYNNRLVASAGRLTVEELNTLLQNGTNYAGMEIRHQPSSVPGFRYVYLEEPQKILTSTLVGMIIAGLAALGASIGIMWLITRGMYRPIRGVLQTTGEQFTAGDEIAHIRNTIVSLHTDVEEMSLALAKHKTSQENNTLHDLLIGVIPPEQAGQSLSLFPQLQIGGPFAVILLKYTETAQFTGGFSHGVTYDAKQRLSRALEQYFAPNPLFRLMDMNFENQAVILHADKTEGLVEGLRNIIIGVEPEYGLDISAFIPPFCETLDDLAAAYRQGMKMADAREYLGSNAKVIHWEEVNTPLKSTVYYPLQVEQNLINSVIHGNTPVWQSAVNEIIDTNTHERRGSQHALALMFGATVNRIMDGSGAVDPELSYGSSSAVAADMDIRFRACRTYEELRQQALQVFGSLAAWFAAEREKFNNSLADRMLAYVHEHYMSEITLFDLADYLNLSRNYVSTLFKSSTGRNFKDYISEYRYGKACQMIRENPDMKIKEIAELVGCNTDALSRLFMRYSGMLPNDFRQQASREKEKQDQG